MARKNAVLTYRTEDAAKRAMARHLKRYSQRHGRPVHPDCKVDVVLSPSWLYPFQYLIRLTGADGSVSYWSRA